MTKMVAIPTVAAQPRLVAFVHYCNTAVARREVMEIRIHQTGSIDLLVRSRWVKITLGGDAKREIDHAADKVLDLRGGPNPD